MRTISIHESNWRKLCSDWLKAGNPFAITDVSEPGQCRDVVRFSADHGMPFTRTRSTVLFDPPVVAQKKLGRW
jgi:hypothetical protein